MVSREKVNELDRSLSHLEAKISQRHGAGMDNLEEVQAIRTVYEILGNELGVSEFTEKARYINETLASGR